MMNAIFCVVGTVLLFNVYCVAARPISNVHGLFEKSYPGGSSAFQEALRERADWSPLQIFEYSKNSTWAEGPSRFNALGPVVQCPTGVLETFAKGDGEKRICGDVKSKDCVVISVGSRNEWDFEVDLIAKYPQCVIHTLDCYVGAVTVPESIKHRTTFHPICLGTEDKTHDGRKFMTWGKFAAEIGLKKAPTALKMDIEGYEWAVIPAMIKSNVFVPESFSFELHYVTNRKKFTDLDWSSRRRLDPEIGLFSELMFHLGYVLVDRNDNPYCAVCSEIVMAKLLPNTRFVHHNGASNFARNGSTQKSILNVLPYPTKPHE
jgi:hypothetical protein